MNQIWFWLIFSSILVSAWSGTIEKLTETSFQAAKNSVNLAIGLTGAMALWLGLVRIAEAGGLMTLIARAIRPVMTRLFPDVPPEHPAMSAMILNMAANTMGLGNAATPLGIKAMSALNRLNPCPGRATDAMCLFLAINTSNVTLLPLGTIAVRASAGASEPAAILLPSVLATTVSTTVAVIAAKLLRRIERPKPCRPHPSEEADSADKMDFTETPAGSCEDIEEVSSSLPAPHRGATVTVLGAGAIFLAAAAWQLAAGKASITDITGWVVPALMLLLVGFGYSRNVPVYEMGVEGAKEGFKVAVRLIPFLVMILVAAALFRESGAFRLLATMLEPVTSLVGIPPEVIPMALLRPLSGSGAFGLMSEITMHAPDSYAAYLAATIQGSTETTFYVLAVYFGAVGIKDTRYAVAAALSADLAGAIAAVIICRLTFAG